MSISTFYEKLDKPIAIISGIVGIIATICSVVFWYQSYRNQCELNGEWKFVFYTDHSSLKASIGDCYTYKIYIHQDGDKINGAGEKCEVNNIEIPYSEHAPFDFTGFYKEKVLHANFTLHGSKRTTVGSFALAIEDNKKMQGTFSGTAANTKGRVIATKVE